jgi:modulator of FtsH protease HflC
MEPAAARDLVSGSMRGRTRLRLALLVIVPAAAAWALVSSLFTVDVTEYGLVTRFGNVVRVLAEPGLHLKAPFDRVLRLDKRLTYSRPVPAEYLTVDKRNVVVESLAIWRIADPRHFAATLATRANADVPLGDVVAGEIGAVVGRYPASFLIAPDGDARRFGNLVSEIRERVSGYARAAYGIDIVDVKLLHLTLPEQNREHVFERMKAERGKIAKEHRTAGELQARKIVAEADREKSRIEAEAYEKAQRLRAEGDAEASRIYAAGFNRNPAFYKFLRTLQAYDKFLDENTTLFLPADAEVLRMLRPVPQNGSAGPRQSTTTTAKRRPDPAPAVSVARPARAGAGSAPAANLSNAAEAEPQ